MFKDPTLSGVFAVFGFLIFIVLILALIVIIANWKIFTRHYKLPGWYSIIPFYGNYKQAQMTFGAKYGIIGIIASCIGGIEAQVDTDGSGKIILYLGMLFTAVYTYYIADRLTNSTGVKLLAVFIPIIGYPVLAFSSSCSYKGPKCGEAPSSHSSVKFEEPQHTEEAQKPAESTEKTVESETKTIKVEPEEVKTVEEVNAELAEKKGTEQ